MSFIGKKLLYEKNQIFPNPERLFVGMIEKVEPEPFSYYVEDCKMYVFKDNDIRDFIKWYLEYDRDEFLFDFLSNDGGTACHKYFKLKGVNYDTELFIHFDEWVKDREHFIDYCTGQYKKMQVYKRKDWFFKFATKNSFQIKREN